MKNDGGVESGLSLRAEFEGVELLGVLNKGEDQGNGLLEMDSGTHGLHFQPTSIL